MIKILAVDLAVALVFVLIFTVFLLNRPILDNMPFTYLNSIVEGDSRKILELTPVTEIISRGPLQEVKLSRFQRLEETRSPLKYNSWYQFIACSELDDQAIIIMAKIDKKKPFFSTTFVGHRELSVLPEYIKCIR